MKYKNYILICGGTGCESSKADDIYRRVQEELKARNLESEAQVIKTGCFGFCEKGPIIKVLPDDSFYVHVKPDDVKELVEEHIVKGRRVARLLYNKDDAKVMTKADDIGFYQKQVRVVLRNCGFIDPENIEEYIARDGYAALEKVLFEIKPDDVIEELKKSGLRGRGGAGFPTWRKWLFTKNAGLEAAARFTLDALPGLQMAIDADLNAGRINEEQARERREKIKREAEEYSNKFAPGGQKYVVCNADEGDPGAYMDRSTLEGDPHSVLEAMTIAGHTVGANQGYIYIRAEYPLAIHRLEIAIKQAKELGLLGKDILGSGFDFDIEIRLGAGAFVCGEETALLASLEGKRGMPVPRPPFPAVKGLWGKPTVINNVETWANIPVIITKGGDWFGSLGTENSKGTKVFALTGKITNSGLIEVPMGITLREIIYDIGGGIPKGKKFKAVQTGGPSGGVITADYLDTPIDFDNLAKLGSIMGSGGMIVMDEDDCMVDVTKFYLEFTVDESCGKCAPCRIGGRQLFNHLEKITNGEGTEEDIRKMRVISQAMQRASLCALGQTAPNPVISTLKYFENEYMAHIKERRCPAGKCSKMVRYSILAEKCIGCGLCAKKCPADCIAGEKKQAHVIDSAACIKCGACERACKFGAVVKN